MASQELEIWDPSAKLQQRKLPLYGDTPLHDLTWSPSGDRIAARTSGAEGVIIDVHSGKRTLIPERSDVWERGPSWSPDGRFLATIVESISAALRIVDRNHGTMPWVAWAESLGCSENGTKGL